MPSLRRNFRAWKQDVLEHRGRIGLAAIFFLLAFFATTYSSTYVDKAVTASVPDLILDAIPVVDLSFLFIWGAIIVFVVYVLYPLFYEPRRFHYAIGMLSLFVLVRSGFVILTHLKAPAEAIVVTTPHFLEVFRYSLSYSNDLFFSGHTGLPFLGFLIFKNRAVRLFMLLASFVFAATVLLMHVHYSIDVASAFFITYGVYVIGNKLFLTDSKNRATAVAQ